MVTTAKVKVGTSKWPGADGTWRNTQSLKKRTFLYVFGQVPPKKKTGPNFCMMFGTFEKIVFHVCVSIVKHQMFFIEMIRTTRRTFLLGVPESVPSHKLFLETSTSRSGFENSHLASIYLI